MDASPDLKPIAVQQVRYAFPTDVADLLPKYETLPVEFQNGNKWTRLASTIFFGGMPEGVKINVKESIDGNEAIRHVMTCLRSFEPKHEHKEAGVGYLLSLWFDVEGFPS